MPCEHEKHVAKRHYNNADHFGYQCSLCGKWEPVKKEKLTWAERSSAVEFDAELQTRLSRELAEKYQREREEKNRKWWDDYSSYLSSQKWMDKRERVLKRDKICQACLKRPATQAHHLTYKHAFDEPLFDLVGVCELCHEAIHQREREGELSRNAG